MSFRRNERACFANLFADNVSKQPVIHGLVHPFITVGSLNRDRVDSQAPRGIHSISSPFYHPTRFSTVLWKRINVQLCAWNIHSWSFFGASSPYPENRGGFKKKKEKENKWMAISLDVIICTSSLFRGVFISPDMIKVNKIKDRIKVNSRRGHRISVSTP